MKTFYKYLAGVCMATAFIACERDFDAPPLTEPVYTGPKANITIIELKEIYKEAVDKAITIEDEYILQARVAASDESGNIYKQMVLQDETGGIVIGVDQGSTYTTYEVGQEVFVQLKGLCMSSYGKELQLGHPDGYLYRTPWEDFQKHVLLNGWPDKDKLNALIVTDFSKLDKMVDEAAFTLVKLNKVEFVNGGKNTFAPENAYGQENLKDEYGNTLMVRTSSYASFAANKLPKGKGTMLGILGRFNGAWQLTVRDANDIQDFQETPEEPGNPDTPIEPDQPETPDKPDISGKLVFLEGFGNNVEKVNNYWPGVDAYKGWDNQNLTFSDPDMTGTYSNASVRKTSTLDPHVWFAADKDSKLKIEGFSTAEHTTLTLSYDITFNQPNGATGNGNQNAIKVYAGDKELTLPNKEIAKDNTYEKVTITGIPTGFTSITFSSEAAVNTKGYRIDNVKLIGE